MVIVIDLSRKMVGFNLFESFFYKFKSEGTLFFANNPLKVDDEEIDYAELKTHVQNILYDHHASFYSLCVLYDMDDQRKNPIRNSIASNIHEIKENIIKPLQQDYTFDKLYYFSLDSVKRNYDGIPIDDNIKVAIDYDGRGYLHDEEIDTKYTDILFTEEELRQIDRLWCDIRTGHLHADNLSIADPKMAAAEFKAGLNKYFDSKLDSIQSDYRELAWYGTRLSRVFKTVFHSFESALYKNTSSVYSITAPSELMRQSLKMEVSTHRERAAIIIHVDLSDKNTNYPKLVLRFRHQLEIIALLIYLATNDTSLVFEGGQTLNRENHWEISTILSDEQLAKMLNSYNSKLKTELERLGSFTSNEITYEEFSPRTFNLAVEMRKPSLPDTPDLGLFSRKTDGKKLENFVDRLYTRYLRGVDYANKRVRELTAKLRVQKESTSSGRIKQGNILEVNAELDKMQTSIKELQERIAVYRPKEAVAINPNLKYEYRDAVAEIRGMMSERMKLSTFIKNILLTMGISLCSYPILQLSDLPDKTTLVLSLLMLILPAAVYSGLQVAYSILLKKQINKKIQAMVQENEGLVNNLFRNDNEASKYVQDIYNLIMQRKYVSDCQAKIVSSNRKLKQFTYHHDKLRAHAEVSDKLIEILGIDIGSAGIVQIEKIAGLEDGKTAETNPLYCPLSYLMIADPIKNSAIINNQKNVDIDSNLIGFVEKFIINHDKEYRHD